MCKIIILNTYRRSDRIGQFYVIITAHISQFLCVDNFLNLKLSKITVDRHDYKKQTKHNYVYNL